jgi:hypothetical protein
LEDYQCKTKTKSVGKELCEQAAVEHDPRKFEVIIRQLNQVLEEKEQRLKKAQRPSGQSL